MNLGTGEATILGVVTVGDNFYVFHGIFRRGDDGGTAPDGAGGADAVDHDAIVLSLIAIGDNLCAVFGLENAIVTAGSAPASLCAGKVVVVAAAAVLRAIGESAGSQFRKLEHIAAEGGQMLNLVAGDDAVDGGGLGLQRGQRRGIHVDGLRGRADVESNVEAVGLIGNQDEMVEDLLLEAGLFDLEAEIHVGGGEGVEVENTRGIADADLLFAGRGIGEREVGSGNDCAGGVGHDALNGSSILRLDQCGQCNDADDQQCDADGYVRTPHEISLDQNLGIKIVLAVSADLILLQTFETVANHLPNPVLNLWKSDLVNSRRNSIAGLNLGVPGRRPGGCRAHIRALPVVSEIWKDGDWYGKR